MTTLAWVALLAASVSQSTSPGVHRIIGSGAPPASTEQATNPGGAAEGVVAPAGPSGAPDVAAQPASNSAAPIATQAGAPPAAGNEWAFSYGGYFRAPMRVGVAKRTTPEDRSDERTFHLPLVPDDQSLSWQHTNHSQTAWAEMFLGYGNARARGVLGIESYSFTDPMWTDAEAQLGISKGYIEFEPRLPWPLWTLRIRGGAFGDSYGRAGKYDGGEFDTYLFGRLHQMGETMRATVAWRKFVFGMEHGVGTSRPNPSVHNNARFSLIHHAHLDVTWRSRLTLSGHFIRSRASEEDRHQAPASDDFTDARPGKMTVLGGDLKWYGRKFGYVYSGFSFIEAKNAGVVGAGVEVLHAKGAGEWNIGVVGNYLESSGIPSSYASGGNGRIYTYLGQYEHSVQSFLRGRHGEGFWGDGPDVGVKIYGMLMRVDSADQDADMLKLKYGADLYYNALPWLGAAVRYDRLQPNNDNADQSFSILSPRVFLRSDFVTHEALTFQYSRYFYNRRLCAQDELADCVQPAMAPRPHEGWGNTGDPAKDLKGSPVTLGPDLDVFSITATIWW